jgi:hypothetical protein
MRSSHVRSLAGVLALAATLTVPAVPALADAPLSVELGAQLPQQSNARNAGGDVQTGFGVNYDFIRAPIVPVQVSLAFDDANGSNGNGKLDDYGIGVAGRLTTPLYAGIGFSVYTVNARVNAPSAPSFTSTGIGTTIFAGERFLTLPGGVSFALQGTYKQLPSFQGINPSSIGVGLRVQL